MLKDRLTDWVFPSPCGVMERKYKQAKDLGLVLKKGSKVSVPLRGNGAKELAQEPLLYLASSPQIDALVN